MAELLINTWIERGVAYFMFTAEAVETASGIRLALHRVKPRFMQAPKPKPRQIVKWLARSNVICSERNESF
jgi:hypothetical protein